MLTDFSGIPGLPTPRIATGYVEAIRIDLTRPVTGAFRVRIFADGFPVPPEDVMAAFVLYGASVQGLARRIEWEQRPARSVRSPAFHELDYDRGFDEVLEAIERLQGDRKSVV